MEENKLAAIIANTPVTYENKFDETKFPLAKITQHFEGGESVSEKFYCFSGNDNIQGGCRAFLCFRDDFEEKSENLLWDDLDRFENIHRVLKGTAKAFWNNKIATDQAIVSRPEDHRYNAGMIKLQLRFCGGRSARDNLRAYLESKAVMKARETPIDTHRSWMEELFSIYNRLEGRMYGQLTDLEEKFIMLNTFPHEWVDNFFHSGRQVYSVDMEDLCDYMRSEKKIADIAGITQVKKTKTKDTQTSSNKRVQENNATEANYTNERVRQVGQYNQCRRHPNHHHTWEECFF